MTAILHTHTGRLDYHPHLHVIVPGGGVDKTRKQWKKLEGKFLFNEFALANLCLSEGCDPEEAAARLGYAAWNLDKAFQRQLREARGRGEVDSATRRRIASDAAKAERECSIARAGLLEDQPRLPTEAALQEAQKHAESCLAILQKLVAAL